MNLTIPKSSTPRKIYAILSKEEHFLFYFVEHNVVWDFFLFLNCYHL